MAFHNVPVPAYEVFSTNADLVTGRVISNQPVFRLVRGGAESASLAGIRWP